MNMPGETLADESSTYDANVAQWVKEHGGEFVLIRGTDVVGFYATYEQGLTEGYSRFGVAPFFVKQISHPRQAHFISRPVVLTSVP